MEHVDILAFGAHPDDVEIGMAGTLAKHQLAGYRTVICDLTYAEMSSNGTVEKRQQEAGVASEVLQLFARETIGLPDRGLQLVDEHIQAVVRMIRRYRPRIVFAPYWEDRHPDHVMCSRIVQEAVFNAKLRRYMPDIEAHLVDQVYYYFINDIAPADLIVDVSDVYDHKRSALLAYESQFTAPSAQTDIVSTPLNQGYVERVEARDSLLGQGRGMTQAEAFIHKGPYAVHLF
ncbi:bacillithiol biosynthesis deacetylase BshB1 [Paenibacillus sp. ACRRX]|uniref:bacillithiol biosynthesis deacetylase BshB1 n=1 Tax=unclassified Paenibacillus TaxID=185978 RepID=UPI001EF5941C|nr:MULTISPECIES: bacillithiol biosynthesis deacetylase BshB1 [unclassified Paenibacillus]MCG7406482.1 bacillithiol biosynthesis deacetylase BshB1 [Paenibacillus sp. ACRRX]MDK8179514.1 bacillithiol biosynthesis deacetylase BshB1 [Paenibacillus sp. UMB4589-SE434]